MRKSTGPSEPLVIPKDISQNDAVRSAATKKCPHCAEFVAAAATSCCHCGQTLPATAEPKKDPWEGYDI
jgi:hypothetical protein